VATRIRLALLASALVLPVMAFAALSASAPENASAHPLGNFTINRYSRIELYSDAIRVRYVLDMAEIPAFEEIDAVDTNGDGARSAAEGEAYLAVRAPELVENFTLVVDREEEALTVLAQDITYPEGQGGLQTLRVTLLLEAKTQGAGSVEFSDANYSDRIGWKEVVVNPASGVVLSQSSVSATDVSQELTTYPDDLLSSPLDITSASLSFDASDGASAPEISSLGPATEPDAAPNRAGGGFAGLIDSQDLTLTVMLLSLLAALGFGAVHALEPGHGKTFVAAYFVGVKGTAGEAMLLGLIVAATHTIGVFAIGLLTLFGSQYILPEDLYPWLSLASGLMILVLGVRLLALRYRGVGFLRRVGRSSAAQDHDHPHGDGHHHHPHEPQPVSSPWKGLIALGLADGLTPSPSALVVLLAAISLDRIGLGVLLIVAFSLGLAAVLTLVSLALVYARRIIDWFGARGHGVAAHPLLAWATGSGSSESALMTMVPVVGAIALTGVGLVLTIRALSGPGLPI
jgi:ABC-type nickel/cobalt efflux system permease component RcnA